MRNKSLTAVSAAILVAQSASALTPRHRVAVRRTVGGAAGHAVLGQIRNSPHEWGQGAAGFGKRFGSGLGQGIAKAGIQHGVGKLLHENLHYQRSNLHGTWPRLKYAVRSTFIVPRTDRRGKTLAGGRFAGAFGAGMISRAWQPASSAGIGAGFASGGIMLGADVGSHVAREFWPRHEHPRVVRARATAAPQRPVVIHARWTPHRRTRPHAA